MEEVFGDYITINSFDIDASAQNAERYVEIVSRLENFDMNYIGNAPFIVFEGLFAKLGYDDGTAQYYIDDVKRAVKGEKLDSFLDATNDRFFI